MFKVFRVACRSTCSVTFDSLQPFGLKSTRLLCQWDFPGNNTRGGCQLFLQGIFPSQGLNARLLCLLHCRQIFYPLSHWGKPNIKGKGAVKSFRAGPKFGTFHYLIFHHFWWSLSTMRNVRKDTQPSSSCVPMYNRPKADRVQGKGHSANLYNREVVTGKSENFASWLSKTRGQGSPCLLQRVLKSPVFIFLFFISNRTLYFSLDPWPPS